MEIKGKVWKFVDNISTDIIMPNSVTFQGKEPRLFCMGAIRPGWAKIVKAGDIIVAGENFGCGSGRSAPRILKQIGIAAVIASSFSRIFFRNSINSGFPVVECPEICSFCEEGDTVEIYLFEGIVKNIITGNTIKFESFPSDSPPYDILKAGGIGKLLSTMLSQGKSNE